MDDSYTGSHCIMLQCIVRQVNCKAEHNGFHVFLCGYRLQSTSYKRQYNKVTQNMIFPCSIHFYGFVAVCNPPEYVTSNNVKCYLSKFFVRGYICNCGSQLGTRCGATLPTQAASNLMWVFPVSNLLFQTLLPQWRKQIISSQRSFPCPAHQLLSEHCRDGGNIIYVQFISKAIIERRVDVDCGWRGGA